MRPFFINGRSNVSLGENMSTGLGVWWGAALSLMFELFSMINILSVTVMLIVIFIAGACVTI